MAFNSFEFAIFLILVFSAFWSVSHCSLNLRNGILLAASYIFYGWWDWRFLILILISSAADFYLALRISCSGEKKKRVKLLLLSLVVNIGLLGFFKYFNFFIQSWLNMCSILNFHQDVRTLNIILPVGISFYTFQTLSYTIDVYKGKISPTRNIITFFTFVGFFPQLVAGPIERASHLLPQFERKNRFEPESAIQGIHQIIWGLFKKIAVADVCAEFVNEIYGHSASCSGIILLLGTVAFAFQIYCDFSGYSDIAIGTARLFGIRLMTNFRMPYFSRNIPEFWRKWHISLSTWFRDYVYIPMGGSRASTPKVLRNVLVLFLVSGLWHGANWTFVVWGGVNALFMIPFMVFRNSRASLNVPEFADWWKILITFGFTCFAWIFFRSGDLSQAFHVVWKIGTLWDSSLNMYIPNLGRYAFEFLPVVLLLVTIEWTTRKETVPICGPWRTWKAVFILALTVIFGNFVNPADFIYFQF